MVLSKGLLLTSVSAAGLLASSSALAAEVAANSAAHDEGAVTEVVVTAFKRTETLQQAPAAISAVTSRALQDRGIQGVEELQYAVPSLQAGKLLGGTALSIRGVGLNQGSPGVAVHADGVYQPRPAMGDLAQTDLERVEVLRGPQGTLYGRNANGGAVNFISKAPGDRLEAYVLGSVASYDEYRLQGMVNVPISDRVRSRVVVDYWDREHGFVTNVTPGGQDLDKGRTVSGRARLDLDLTNTLKLDLSLSLLHSTGPQSYFTLHNFPSDASIAKNPYLSGAIVPTAPWLTSANDLSTFHRNYGSMAATFTWELGGATIKSISAYQTLNDNFHTDSDGTNLSAFPQYNHNKSTTFTQEVNVSGKVGALNLVGGVYYMDDRAPTLLFYNFPLGIYPLPPGATLTFDTQRYDTQAIAGFADGTWGVTSKFRLIGGLRYSVDRQSVTQYNEYSVQVAGNTVHVATCPVSSYSKDFPSFTPRVGAQYDFSSDVNVYATISRGFKAGGFNASGCGQAFNPEKITAYEAGLKSRLFDRSLTFNLTGFYYDYTDLQLQQVVGLTGQITNAAAAEIRGLEVEGVWTPDSHWTVNANLTLLHAVYSKFSNTDSLNPTLGVQDVAGRYLNNAPTSALNVGVAYRTDETRLGRFTGRVDVSYRSTVYFREFNLPLDSQAPYTLVNLGLIWDTPDEHYKVRVFANNITNTGYIVRMGSSDNFGSRYVSWGNPRQYGVEVRRSF
jgi:iron complex outermembrane recepter protein